MSTVSPECLHPHLTAITTVMLLALKSNEGITVRRQQTGGTVKLSVELVSLKDQCFPSLQAHVEEDKTFVLLDDDDDDDEEEKDDYLEDESESDVHDVTG